MLHVYTQCSQGLANELCYKPPSVKHDMHGMISRHTQLQGVVPQQCNKRATTHRSGQLVSDYQDYVTFACLQLECRGVVMHQY